MAVSRKFIDMRSDSIRRAAWIAAALTLACVQMGQSQGSCRYVSERDAGAPDSTVEPEGPDSFQDSFNGTLSRWRFSVPFAPALDDTFGNLLPSMAVGSSSLNASAAVTVPAFAVAEGLQIEADVFVAVPDPPAATPEAWMGLSADKNAAASPTLAAGMHVDGGGMLNFILNNSVLGSMGEPARDRWHRWSVTITKDGPVEFRVDGVLVLSAGAMDPAYDDLPVKVGGIGYPERPHIDNVSVTHP
ncbi:MAG: hypothetical protein HY716_11255 [Planctomycetes bacterium]|nr:hypothetical protein [Planctomycetota bacterium]